MYRRPHFKELVKRLKEARNFIQVLAGPRQTGKTTLIHQVLETVEIPSHYASADDVPNRSKTWIEQQWEIARLKTRTAGKEKEFILALDEIQKINGWTETVKKLWDEDEQKKILIKVVLLGSSPLLLQEGLDESLGGRFEMIYVSHWSFKEMRDAFGLFQECKTNPELWGRWVESSIGAYLINALKGTRIKVFYWREKDKEVDFVLEKGGRKVAIEVKSGSRKERLPGIDWFSSTFPRVKPLLVGKNGFPPEDFLQINPNDLFD